MRSIACASVRRGRKKQKVNINVSTSSEYDIRNLWRKKLNHKVAVVSWDLFNMKNSIVMHGYVCLCFCAGGMLKNGEGIHQIVQVAAHGYWRMV